MNYTTRERIANAACAAEQLFSTPKATARRLASKITCPKHADCSTCPYQNLDITPLELARRIYYAAYRSALPYDSHEPRNCPRYLIVEVPKSSWKKLYRHSTATIEQWVAGAVYQRIRTNKTLFTTGPIKVSIRPGKQVACRGVQVELHYTDPSRPRRHVSNVQRHGALAHAAATVGRAPAGAAAAEPALAAVPSTMGRAGSTDPNTIAIAPYAVLIGEECDGALSRYPVRNGDIVGVVRGKDPVRPSVCLPIESHPFASRQHLYIRYCKSDEGDTTGGTWQLEQLGRHGSAIVHGNETTWLKRGDIYPLTADDTIILPCSTEVLVFSDADTLEL